MLQQQYLFCQRASTPEEQKAYLNWQSCQKLINKIQQKAEKEKTKLNYKRVDKPASYSV